MTELAMHRNDLDAADPGHAPSARPRGLRRGGTSMTGPTLSTLRVIRRFGIGCDRRRGLARAFRLFDPVRFTQACAQWQRQQRPVGRNRRAGITRTGTEIRAAVAMGAPKSVPANARPVAPGHLLIGLERQYRKIMLSIRHDLGDVSCLADCVVVMYPGENMEQVTTRENFDPPVHPCTEVLLSAVPGVDCGLRRERIIVERTESGMLDPPRDRSLQTRDRRKLGAMCELVPMPDREARPGQASAATYHWMNCGQSSR